MTDNETRNSIKVTKSELKALEKVFISEINNCLPLQSKAKIYSRLRDEGYLEDMSRVYGANERFPITVTGYQLTHLGRITYCASCRDAEDDPE